MTYDEFKQAWISALRESRLRVFGVDALRERIDLRATDRLGESVVEPYGQPEPFTVTARFRWRWDALHSARTATSEEDMLVALFGRETASRPRTHRPWMRVDISLHASLQMDKPMPLPSKATWAVWTRDVIQTLESRAPIIPADTTREVRGGNLEILGWQGDPEAEVLCLRDGELKLHALKIEAWQAIELARKWSDSSRRPDKGVGEQLDQMFVRVDAALRAWAELTIQLRNAN
jgi:hypothetical protein